MRCIICNIYIYQQLLKTIHHRSKFLLPKYIDILFLEEFSKGSLVFDTNWILYYSERLVRIGHICNLYVKLELLVFGRLKSVHWYEGWSVAAEGDKKWTLFFKKYWYRIIVSTQIYLYRWGRIFDMKMKFTSWHTKMQCQII